MKTKFLKANYSVSICTAIGWRTRTATAILERVSEKRAKVISVSIPEADSRRQNYYNKTWEKEEIGKIKNISTLKNVEEVEEI